MGGNLYIRVSAATYNPDEVGREWPKLYRRVWPESSTSKIDQNFGLNARGVMELASGAVEKLIYGQDVQEKPAQIRAQAEKLRQLLRSMEDALGDRDVKTASKLSNDIESALDSLENMLPNE